MTGMLGAFADDVPQCLLCGGAAHVQDQDGETVVWDLCARCDGVFQVTAARVAAAVLGPRMVVVQIPGQIALDAEAGCSCGWQGANADVDAHLEVCELPDPWAFEDDEDDQP